LSDEPTLAEALDRIGHALHELREPRVHVEDLDEVARAIHGVGSIHIDGLRDEGEWSLVRVIGETRGELDGIGRGLSDIAYAIRGLPGWTEPDQ
jgi:hypothetical protein